MQVHRSTNVQEFCTDVVGYLQRQESRNNLLLAILDHLNRQENGSIEPAPYLAWVESEGAPIAVAIQTPPYPLVLSAIDPLAAISLIVQDRQTLAMGLPGVNAPAMMARYFADCWCHLTGQTWGVSRNLRLYELTAVSTRPLPDGHLRQATEADRPCLLAWGTAFAMEIHDPIMQQDVTHWCDRVLQRGNAYLWETQQPVCLACCTCYSSSSARIGPVYTPPVHRHQGYATACVATLSQRLLDRGYRACYLFADAANGASNQLYQAIGYQPLETWAHYSFFGSRDLG